ncbi:MAG: hypothetical protein AB8E82_11215 [Aureispira sp.]
MSISWIILFWSCTAVVYGQITRNNIATIDTRQKYLYNNNKDTLILDDVDATGSCMCAPLEVITTFSTNAKGGKAIVFYRSCAVHSSHYQSSFYRGHQSTIKKYEVWDLEAQKCLFGAVHSYKSYYKEELMYKTRCKQYKRKKSRYSYTFKIEKQGSLWIQNLQGKDKHLADHAVGMYVFKNGHYERQ